MTDIDYDPEEEALKAQAKILYERSLIKKKEKEKEREYNK